MSETAHLMHRLPRRVRIAVPERRGDQAYFNTLIPALRAIPTVQSAHANPRAASVTLHFHGFWDDLRAQLAPLLALQPPPASRLPAGPPTHLVTGRDLGPPFLAGVVFLALGIVQLMRGHIGVPAVTAFWYASTTFQQAGLRLAVEPDTPSGDTSIRSPS